MEYTLLLAIHRDNINALALQFPIGEVIVPVKSKYVLDLRIFSNFKVTN